jgi:hypothetical protein
MFARRALRRPGVGVIGDGAYATSSSAAKHSSQEASQNQQLGEPQAQRQAQAMAATPVSQAPSSGLTDEKMEQLRKLGEMKKEGILTNQEFEAQKQRLLS